MSKEFYLQKKKTGFSSFFLNTFTTLISVYDILEWLIASSLRFKCLVISVKSFFIIINVSPSLVITLYFSVGKMKL